MVQLDPPVADGEPDPAPEPEPAPAPAPTLRAPAVYLGNAPIGVGSPWFVASAPDGEPEPDPATVSDPAPSTEEP